MGEGSPQLGGSSQARSANLANNCNPKYLCIANSISIQIHKMLFHLTLTDFVHASIMPTHHSALVKALETIYGAAFLQNHCVSWVLHCSNIKMATLTSKKCSVFKSNQYIVLVIFKSDLPFKNSSNDHAVGQRGWQVLHAVHHKVHLRQRCSSSHSYSSLRRAFTPLPVSISHLAQKPIKYMAIFTGISPFAPKL